MFLAGRFGIAAQRFAMAGQPWTDMILSVGMERPRHAGAPGEDGESSRGRLLVPSLYGLAEMAVAEDADRLLAVRCGSI